MIGDGKIATRLGRRFLWVPVALVAFYAAVSWPGWQRQAGEAAGLSARVACSCRYIEGRDLKSCRSDLSGIAWMPLVRYSDDPKARRVSTSVPLLASRSAKLKDGFGCLPER